METAFAELPLALFTTLAPIGAGAFIALAIAFFTTDYDEEQLKKIDKLTLIPLIVVLVGFAASFFHLASPTRAFGVFAGLGSSPLSNEILVGSVFVVLAAVYVVLGLIGKLGGARKALIAVVAVAALVFAAFTGMAYMMDTIASWNTPLVPLQIVGFCLVGGSVLGILVLASAGALAPACEGAFKTAMYVMAIVGALIAVGALVGQVASVNTMSNPLVSGADIVSNMTILVAASAVGIISAAAGAVCAVRGISATTMSALALVLVLVGVFAARLAFYGLQMSVGL